MSDKKKVMAVCPYLGELGWEAFCWEPMLRNLHVCNSVDETYVWTGRGKRLMYQWANVREIDLPAHESECLVWHDFEKYKGEYVALMEEWEKQVRQEFNDCILHLFDYRKLQRHNYPYYERAMAAPFFNLDLEGKVEVPWTMNYGDRGKMVALCIRDRDLSDFRNWPAAKWQELVDGLTGQGYSVVLLGKVRDRFPEITGPEGYFLNLLNKTTLDQCIYLLSEWVDLAVGGSSGLLHVASRCLTPHLVWGGAENVMEALPVRYAMSNFHGTPHRVYEWGWDPDVEAVMAATVYYLENEEFLPQIKCMFKQGS